MSNQFESRVYVDLDCLLDTRLGTLHRITNGDIGKYLFSEKYYLRDEDVFEGVDKEVFKREYGRRDKETLKVSTITQMTKELAKIVLDLMEESHSRPERGKVSVDVNIYPYNLNDKEKEAIANCIFFYTGEVCDINIINLRPSGFTPAMVKDTYVVVIMYDYGKWFEINANQFTKPLLFTSLLAPKIYFLDKPTGEDLKELSHAEEPFEAMELLTRGLIDLQLIPIAKFSVIPPNPEPKEEKTD